MSVSLELYPELSHRLLTFINAKEQQSSRSTKFLEYCVEEVEDFLYLDEEDRLIVSESFRHAVRVEIRGYIDTYREQQEGGGCGREVVGGDERGVRTIYGGFELFDSQKETILWDLLTLLVFLDSLNPQIWDRRATLIGGLLERRELESDYVAFLKSELGLTRLALCHAFKYGEIWCYLEYISRRYYERTIKKDSKLASMSSVEVIGYVLDEHDRFISLQLDLYEHSYYAWSYVNWLINELVPVLISHGDKPDKFFGCNEIEAFERWVIRLIQRYPSQYGGYHALVNLSASKMEEACGGWPKRLEVDSAMELVYPEETLRMLRVVIDCFNDHHVDCFAVILGFRYANFMLLVDWVDERSHFRVFESEIRWFLELGLVEKMSRSKKHLEELREHFYSIMCEISSSPHNQSIIQDFNDLLDSELEIVRQGPTMFYSGDGPCPDSAWARSEAPLLPAQLE